MLHRDNALKKEEQRTHSYHTATNLFSRQTQVVFMTNPTLQQKCCLFYSFSVRPLHDLVDLIAADFSRLMLSQAQHFGFCSPRHAAAANHMFGQSDTNASQWITRAIIAQWLLLSYLHELYNHPRVRFGVNTALVFRRQLKTNAIQCNTVALVLCWGLHWLHLKGGILGNKVWQKHKMMHPQWSKRLKYNSLRQWIW